MAIPLKKANHPNDASSNATSQCYSNAKSKASNSTDDANASANATDSIRSSVLFSHAKFCHTIPLCKQMLSILKSLQNLLWIIQFLFIVDGSVEKPPTEPLSERECEIDSRDFVKR